MLSRVNGTTVVGISAWDIDIFLTFAFPVICTDDFSSDSFFYVVTLEKYDGITFSLDACVVMAEYVKRNVFRRNVSATCIIIIIIINEGAG